MNSKLLAIKNTGIYFAASLFTALIGVCINPILATKLSHLDYAIIGYYTSFNLLLVPLLSFSLFSFYSRQYFFVDEDKRDELENTVYASSLVIGIIMLTAFLVFFYLYSIASGLAFPFFPYAIITYFQLYIANTTAFYLLKLKLTKKANKYAIISIAQSVLGALFSIIFVVHYDGGAEGRMYGTLVSAVIVAMIAFSSINFKLKIDTTLALKGIKFGIPLTISAIFWYFLVGVDRVLLEKINNIHELGLYNIAVSITGYMGIFYTSIANTFEPDIYKYIAHKQNKKLLFIMIFILLTVTIANLLFIICAPFLVDILTAGRYTEAAKYARIIALHNITMAIYLMIVKVYIGLGMTKSELVVRITGATLSTCSFYFLIKHYGFIGAAWGQVLSFAILSIIALLFLLLCKTRFIKQMET